MKMVMIGCSHHDSAVDFRERIAFSPEQAGEAINGFRSQFPEAEIVVLSTCNRVELYAARADDQLVERDELVRFLANWRGLSADELMNGLIYRSGAAAIEHLFTVVASLDSLVVGETQILGQVKEAYEMACQVGSAGPLTHAVFQAASHVAKRVARETEIHHRRVSVPSVAIGQVAAEFYETLDEKHIVLIGAGEMSQEALRYLQQEGAKDIRIVNRTISRAETLALQSGQRHVPWSELEKQIIQADLVVSATSASQPIITLEQFKRIEAVRQERMLLVLDLAVPRDFDPRIGECAGVYLYGVDDLKAACERNRRLREKEWPKAKKIIQEETQKLLGELHFRATGPVVQRLRAQAESIKAEEFQRLTAKLEKYAIDPGALGEIQYTIDRVVNKLLHPPLASLRDEAATGETNGLLEALRKLFKI